MGVDNPRAVIAKRRSRSGESEFYLHARLQDPASGGTTDAVHTVIALKTGLPQTVLSLHLFADRGDRGPDGDDGKQPAIAFSGKCLSNCSLTGPDAGGVPVETSATSGRG
jgi:hypothetical protein